MNKKIYLQLFLLSAIIIISYIFYKVYFGQKPVSNTSDKITGILSEKSESNIIYNIEYFTEDERGNSYVVTSKKGEFDSKNTNIILMENVEATIRSLNSDPIIIYSDNALYNKFNYDTNFYKNVMVSYGIHKITSDNLDLIFEKNLLTITNNVIYKNLNTKLEADKIEVDLITKNSKVFMNDKSKKVNIIKLN